MGTQSNELTAFERRARAFALAIVGCAIVLLPFGFLDGSVMCVRGNVVEHYCAAPERCEEADLVAQGLRCDGEDMHPISVTPLGGPYYGFLLAVLAIPALLFARTLNPKYAGISMGFALPCFAAAVFLFYFATWTYAPTVRIKLLWPAYVVYLGSIMLCGTALIGWPIVLAYRRRRAR